MISHEAFDHLLAERIGAVIKREREKADISRPDLARMAGCNRETVRNIELGNYLPNITILFSLLWELDCTQSIWEEIARIDASLRAEMKREAA